MKKKIYLIVIILSCFCLLGCNKKIENNKTSIIGIWETNDKLMTFQFETENMGYYTINTNEYKDTKFEFNYEIKNKEVIFTLKSTLPYSWTYEINNDKLIYKAGSMSVTIGDFNELKRT